MECVHCGYTRHCATGKIGERKAVARFMAWQSACPAKGQAWREGDAVKHVSLYQKRLLADFAHHDPAD